MIDNNTIKKVERDLKYYPDWVIKIECSAPIQKGKSYSNIVSGNRNYSSDIEREVEAMMNLERKVKTIDRVMDRLRGCTKNIIEQKYFYEFGRAEILENNHISKKQYYNLRNRAFESFARALGYIE